MLEMNSHDDSSKTWRPPILATEAIRKQGIPELLSQIEEHKSFLFDREKTHLKKHLRKRALKELVDTIKETVVTDLVQELENSDLFQEMIDDLAEKKTDPFTLCDRIIREMLCKVKLSKSS
jgi:LAO/AO transport system kinase